MLSIPVYTIEGKKSGKLTLDKDFFNGKINKSVLYEVITIYRKNQRQGTASTKTRAAVRGGGKKPWRQKGTGRARTGSIRNPLWKGGGVIFGPHPKDYTRAIPKKLKKLAVKSSLNAKLKSNELIVVEEIKLNQPKTKELVNILSSLDAMDKSLILLEKQDPNIIRAGSNIPGLEVRTFDSFNAYDILMHHKLIIPKNDLEHLIKRLSE